MHMRLLEVANITGGTAGTCMYASFLLAASLNKFERTGCAVICGGDGDGDGGYLDSTGNYWVQATDIDGQSFILDVTADQFGGPEIVCARLDQTNATPYHKGSQDVIDEHVARFKQEVYLATDDDSFARSSLRANTVFF